jgi:glutamate N-acetyltransferase/amino-acid N-acetyltransferase
MAFTKNNIQGAHIAIDKARVGKKCRAILINSGNANCLTGQEGLDNARFMAEETEKLLDIPSKSCLIASTGVIGRQLNMTRIKYGIERLVNVIPNETNIRHFSSGIMTTDTRQKNIAYQVKIGKDTVTLGATAKGDSMIKPSLETMHATLLIFITTDANISPNLLQKALDYCIKNSFNRMSIDNDLSPNDSVFIVANGLAQEEIISSKDDPRYEVFLEVLEFLMINIAKQLIKQGLGVTKLVHLEVVGAENDEEAEKIVRAVSESYQVKTALHGQKTAWQKIVNTVANTSDSFELDKLTISYNKNVLFENGMPNAASIVSALGDMSSIDCTIEINLNSATGTAFLWTCDLTHDYVKINSFINE